MAVQKNKPSRSKRGMRRLHDKIFSPSISKDKNSNELHIRHNITATGNYKGRKVIFKK
ncbi:50S ribosomal protein L32 [Buchnera aphidicola]|uniref:Large ribosomal subunit protein bL32 n=1 Tax=Buchnera aphidicola (Anoecia oenotherae) TaxID=1241833 RepID=A0A4D6XVB8_9GAMM|nr:50S ribosomal protein L32 [Buchnera aphidicola]QCI19397.1 50S ribosomal protein L32 [Buchnera aphidicola (Anoecia oenotherae)]